MTPEVAARVFEPFFTTKPVGQGTGLGLSTAYAVAQQHEGTLSVTSAPGKGSTFVLRLPLAQRPAGAGSNPVLTAFAPARGKPAELLLVVEDDDSVRRAIVRTLAQAGWATREAATGEEALTRFDDAITLVVSDLRMPGIDGVTLVQRLRERRPRLPALLVSGYSDALHTGGDSALPEDLPFLQKPYSSEALCAAVRRGIDGQGAS
jgi:CheY-like chemotaxis protein